MSEKILKSEELKFCAESLYIARRDQAPIAPLSASVGLRDAGQNVFQRSKRALVFGDPIDGELPQLLRLHVDALGYVAPMRPRFPHPLARKGQSILVRV